MKGLCEKCLWTGTGVCADCKDHNKFSRYYAADCDETPDTCLNWGMSDCATCRDKSNYDKMARREDGE